MEASLQSTLSIDLPPGSEDFSSFDALARAVQDRRLWIARDGQCSLSILLTTLQKPLTMLERNVVEGWLQEYKVSFSSVQLAP